MTRTAEALEANPYIPVAPTIKQLLFLSLPHFEAFYGGAGGGGKSEALLMAALMYVEEPGYAAILFRRTFTDLALENSLMDRAASWLTRTDAQWSERDKRWTFPKGATLTFGYLDSPRDWRRYDSAEFQFVGFDEASQFRPRDMNALIQRVRRPKDARVPLRVRYASNPGGEAHDFLLKRFVEPKEPHPQRAFVPALLEDNPYLDRESYEATLERIRELDEVLYQQRRYGVWITDDGDSIFRREWFAGRYDASNRGVHNAVVARYIFWDTAFKEGEERDYSACVVAELSSDYTLYVREVGAWRLEFPDLVGYMEDIAARHNQDRKLRGIVVEDVGAGTSAIQTLREASRWVAPYIQAFRVRGKKTERAREASVWARRGMVKLPAPSPEVSWLHDFEEQLFAFPITEHDDMTDAFVMSILYLRHYLAEGWRARAGTQVA
ncbi:phage terminase large subunit [Rubrobacter calidifluminis]|uniref:phage terminase large subunit n=1 Tax=Rubrobacter calidifluminis TaxID=1392640 RepID=UPI002362EF64|nr:phage terminase large subunit [Rubrobacter calidifluminis]